jgi:hypothetical protein
MMNKVREYNSSFRFMAGWVDKYREAGTCFRSPMFYYIAWRMRPCSV